MRYSSVATAALVLLINQNSVVEARVSRERQILTCQSSLICEHQKACEEFSRITIQFVSDGKIGAPDRRVYVIKEQELQEASELGVADTLVWEDQQGKNLFFFNTESLSDNPAANFVWAIHRIGPGGNLEEHYTGGVIQGTCRWRGV